MAGESARQSLRGLVALSLVDEENEHDACADSDKTAMGPGYLILPEASIQDRVLLQKPYDSEENHE
jgi:hypothetical protein